MFKLRTQLKIKDKLDKGTFSNEIRPSEFKIIGKFRILDEKSKIRDAILVSHVWINEDGFHCSIFCFINGLVRHIAVPFSRNVLDDHQGTNEMNGRVCGGREREREDEGDDRVKTNSPSLSPIGVNSATNGASRDTTRTCIGTSSARCSAL